MLGLKLTLVSACCNRYQWSGNNIHHPKGLISRDHSVHATNQSETTLHCNVVSRWLGAYTKLSLDKPKGFFGFSYNVWYDCVFTWIHIFTWLELASHITQQHFYSISQEICTRFCCALLCCGYAIVHNEFTWSIYPYSLGLLCWHWGNR